jgi:hypothetical protein
MRTTMISERITAVFLSMLLISCSTTRDAASPAADEDLARFVLVIRDLPGGQVSYDWQRAGEFDLSRTMEQTSTKGVDGRVVLAMNQQRDCDEELRECMRECMSRPLPRGFGHTTSGRRGKGGKEEYCNDRCMQPYLDCSKLQELQPQKFTAADSAMDWLKRNHKSILVGSVIVIAGVAFVVVSAGAGLLVLVPVVILASSAATPDASTAWVSP